MIWTIPFPLSHDSDPKPPCWNKLEARSQANLHAGNDRLVFSSAFVPLQEDGEQVIQAPAGGRENNTGFVFVTFVLQR